ncbi:MAG: hypothetical protein ACLFV2_10565, partial [Desulfurivibrionaceae bacterium]
MAETRKAAASRLRDNGQKNSRSQLNNSQKQPESQVAFCSGYGQWHSPNADHNPREYVTITLADIEQMVVNPPCVPKDEAQWVIFSPLPSRVHQEQREQGQFFALWGDIDEPDGLSLDDIADKTGQVVSGKLLIYTSKGATQDRQKCRLIIPLAYPVDGNQYTILQ